MKLMLLQWRLATIWTGETGPNKLRLTFRRRENICIVTANLGSLCVDKNTWNKGTVPPVTFSWRSTPFSCEHMAPPWRLGPHLPPARFSWLFTVFYGYFFMFLSKNAQSDVQTAFLIGFWPVFTLQAHHYIH